MTGETQNTLIEINKFKNFTFYRQTWKKLNMTERGEHLKSKTQKVYFMLQENAIFKQVGKWGYCFLVRRKNMIFGFLWGGA